MTVNAGSGDTVTLINMQLDGQSAAANGIQFNSGFELRVFGGVMGPSGDWNLTFATEPLMFRPAISSKRTTCGSPDSVMANML